LLKLYHDYLVIYLIKIIINKKFIQMVKYVIILIVSMSILVAKNEKSDKIIYSVLGGTL